METYRHALFRYSTGQGFNVNVDVPEIASDVASFQMVPLIANKISDTANVNLKREADRVSMQMEAAYQQIKVLGYDAKAGKALRNLKAQVAVVSHLMTNYPIEFINKKDLENIYVQYAKNSVGMDNTIQKVVKYNNRAKGIDEYVQTAASVRKGYPVYDQFGQKLLNKDKATLLKAEGKTPAGLAGLASFADTETGSGLIKLVTFLLVGAALLKNA